MRDVADFLVAFESRVTADWSYLSTQVTASGVRCVAHVPQVGSKAWLHRFYPGCDSGELDAARMRMERDIPEVWREVLGCSNGARLFIGGLSLGGILPSNQIRRSIEDPQPVSFEDSNRVYRPRGTAIEPADLVIGGSSHGGGAAYVLCPDETVRKLSRAGDDVLVEWPSFEVMLDEEYTSLLSKHDRDGSYIQ